MSNFMSNMNMLSNLSLSSPVGVTQTPLMRHAKIGEVISDTLEKALTPHQSFLSADDRLALRDLIQASPPTPHIYQQIAKILKPQKDLVGVTEEDVKKRLELMVDHLNKFGNDMAVQSKYPHLRSALRKQQMDMQLNEFAIKGISLNPSLIIDRFALQDDVKDENGKKVRELDSKTAQMIRDAIYVVASKSPTFRGAVASYFSDDGWSRVDRGTEGKINITVIDGSSMYGTAGGNDIHLYVSRILKDSQDADRVEFNSVKVDGLLAGVFAHEVGHVAASYKDGKFDEKLQEGPNQHFTYRVGREVEGKNINLSPTDDNGVPSYASSDWSR